MFGTSWKDASTIERYLIAIFYGAVIIGALTLYASIIEGWNHPTKVHNEFNDEFGLSVGMYDSDIIDIIISNMNVIVPWLVVFIILFGLLETFELFGYEGRNLRIALAAIIGSVFGLYPPAAAVILSIMIYGGIWIIGLSVYAIAMYVLIAGHHKLGTGLFKSTTAYNQSKHDYDVSKVHLRDDKYDKLAESTLGKEESHLMKEIARDETLVKRGEHRAKMLEKTIGKDLSSKTSDIKNDFEAINKTIDHFSDVSKSKGASLPVSDIVGRLNAIKADFSHIDSKDLSASGDSIKQLLTSYARELESANRYLKDMTWSQSKTTLRKKIEGHINKYADAIKIAHLKTTFGGSDLKGYRKTVELEIRDLKETCDKLQRQRKKYNQTLDKLSRAGENFGSKAVAETSAADMAADKAESVSQATQQLSELNIPEYYNGVEKKLQELMRFKTAELLLIDHVMIKIPEEISHEIKHEIGKYKGDWSHELFENAMNAVMRNLMARVEAEKHKLGDELEGLNTPIHLNLALSRDRSSWLVLSVAVKVGDDTVELKYLNANVPGNNPGISTSGNYGL